jgi:cyanophycinase
VFKALGVKQVDVLHCMTREQASDAEHIDKLRHAAGVFLTGGDQVRLTSMLGGSLAFECLHDLYARGGTIAGTSAGAAAIMISRGGAPCSPQSSSNRRRHCDGS